MSSDQLKGFSSAFDDMLERNRRELDALAGASSLAHTPRASARPTTHPPQVPPDVTRSAAERALDNKLGPDWRHEILERTRDGDDMIVRCRVTSPSRGISRTQFGSASMGTDTARGMHGKAGGVSFSFAPGTPSSSAAGDTISRERDAERAAVEAALMACARLL